MLKQGLLAAVVASCAGPLGLLGLLAGAAAGQAPAPDRQADHEELRALRQTVVDAVGRLDVDALAPLLASDLSITMLDLTHVTNLEELKAYFDRMFRSEEAVVSGVRIEPEADVLTRFLDDATAVGHGTSRDTYTLTRGGEIVLDSRWTATFVKHDGRWKITALQAGVNALDNPLLRAAGSLKFMWGAGGLVIGLLVGILLARRRASQPA